MTYYRIRYEATVYTSEEVADEAQLEDDIEESFDDVAYQIFHNYTYNVCCEVEKRRLP